MRYIGDTVSYYTHLISLKKVDNHYWIRIPYCEARMKAAKSIPGAVWDEHQQMWRLPKRKGAVQDVFTKGLEECLLDPAVTIPPRYGFARGARKVPHPLARLQAAQQVRAHAPLPHPSVQQDFYATAPERLHADGTVRQTVPNELITPFLNSYTKKLNAMGKAEATVRTYRSAVKLYAEWLPVPLAEATPAMLRAYLDYCADVRCLKDRTIRGVVQAVGVLNDCCLDETSVRQLG